MAPAREFESAREVLQRQLDESGMDSVPRLAVIAGSGLGGFVDAVDSFAAIPFDEIPGLASGQVAGHASKWILGQAAGAPVHVLAGRRHLYEGIAPAETIHAVRILALLGVRLLVISNAAGGLSKKLFTSDLMLIRDHINLQFRNPLVGANLDELGPRFPDMSEPYDPAASAMVRRAAHAEKITLKEGVYAGLAGPSYETPAEIGFLRRLRADAVGMSTVPEVIAARHAGMRVLGISLITNSHVNRPAGGKLSHEEVLEAGRAGQERFTRLLMATLPRLEKLTGSPVYASTER